MKTLLKTILISPCHKCFGGWFRADNIAQRLKGRLLYPPRPERLFKRFLRGIGNAFLTLPYSRVYIFELMPETLFSGLLGLLLRKDIILDVGDEWLASPTYLKANFFKRWCIKTLDHLTPLFPKLTVTSDYLKTKFHKGTKLINGVNRKEHRLYDRIKERKSGMMRLKTKLILSFGNTFGDTRRLWLDKTKFYLKKLDPDIDFIELTGYPLKTVYIWLAICDLVLFPTGDNPCEKACFPIRVGTALNAERVIATDESDTEFHRTLKPYNCMVTGKTPKELALKIDVFFKNRKYRSLLEKNVLIAKKELDWNKLIKKL